MENYNEPFDVPYEVVEIGGKVVATGVLEGCRVVSWTMGDVDENVMKVEPVEGFTDRVLKL